jgi:hypothetical protein
VPQDIPSASPVKNIPMESESSKVDKPPSPSAGKTILEMPNLPGSEDINVPPGVASNLPPLAADPSCDVVHQPSRPDPAVHQDASLISPKSFGLGAHGGRQPSEGSSVPRPEKQSRPYFHVAESLWDNPDFIHARFQAQQEQIKALYSSMKTASELIDVSLYAPSYLLTLRLDSFLM